MRNGSKSFQHLNVYNVNIGATRVKWLQKTSLSIQIVWFYLPNPVSTFPSMLALAEAKVTRKVMGTV